jgi:carboxypeptidase Taq
VTAIEKLRARMAELSDLDGVHSLLAWDQRVMMPQQGAPGRAQQLGTLARIAHERGTTAEIGSWLAELEGAALDELDRDIVRIARRDWERARRVPEDLASELARAHADGIESWQLARENDDFNAFAPALARNVELARAYGECVAGDGESQYDGLLDDYDFGLRTVDLRRIFDELTETLPPLVADAQRHSPRHSLQVPTATEQTAVEGALSRLGVEPASWRVDVSAHPFSSRIGRRDSRVTTRYSDSDDDLLALLISLHEYGHALYERQIDPMLERTNLGHGTSMSIHESQSKLWENHVARNPAYAEVIIAELARGGFEVTPSELHSALLGVKASAIRGSADPLTYPIHIILRFELELALIDGQLAVADLPAAWRDGMRRLLGVQVSSDALGCLQDIHWGAGSFGYFPSYALGCLIAAQLWEAIEAELGPRDDDLRRGEMAPIQRWLAERVHRHGRRIDTLPLVAQATGAPLEAAAFLRYVSPLAGR